MHVQWDRDGSTEGRGVYGEGLYAEWGSIQRDRGYIEDLYMEREYVQ